MARSCFRSQKQMDVAEIGRLYADMRRQAHEDFARIGIPQAQMSYQPTVEMRYAGQFHEVELDVPSQTLTAETLQALVKNFHARYEKMYTYSMSWRDAEFLTFRLKVTAPPVNLASNAQAAGSVEAARRGSRRCLFEGNPQVVQTPAYAGIGWSLATS
jgi:N-methylhydantoinase A